MEDGDSGLLKFAEKFITLLDEGRFNTSYKFALLTALLDISIELYEESDDDVVAISTGRAAEKVLELYWNQALPFKADQYLRAGMTGQAEILTRIIQFRGSEDGVAQTLRSCRERNSSRFQSLLREVEWKLAEQPLPRLQKFGDHEDRFIYEIDWNENVTRRQFVGEGQNRWIRFKKGAAASLARLNGLLRPLIQRKWTEFVATANGDMIEASRLEAFLFGADRVSLERIRDPLVELQAQRCFYCDGGLRSDVHVDHFLPWVRWQGNYVENLVAAHSRCNLAKKDFLPVLDHVSRWVERNRQSDGLLVDAARSVEWDTDPVRVLGAAKGIYLRLPAETLLWRKARVFEAMDRERARHILSL